MHTAALLLACALAAPRRAAAAPAADRVASLPGFGAPLSPFYSGYLAAGPGQRLFSHKQSLRKFNNTSA